MRNDGFRHLGLSPIPGAGPDASEPTPPRGEITIKDLPFKICDRPFVLNGQIPEAAARTSGTFTLHVPEPTKITLPQGIGLLQRMPYESNHGEVAHLSLNQTPEGTFFVNRIVSNMMMLPAPDCNVTGAEEVLLDSLLAVADLHKIAVEVSPNNHSLDEMLLKRGFLKIEEANETARKTMWRRPIQEPDPDNPIVKYLKRQPNPDIGH